jgi:hypothetical protein
VKTDDPAASTSAQTENVGKKANLVAKSRAVIARTIKPYFAYVTRSGQQRLE